VRIHDLRHTYASLLIQQGESLVYIKEQLGHHSIQVTVDIYGHLVPGGNKAAVDRLDGLDHGVGHPVRSGLPHSSSRRTVGRRRYLHGCQDRRKHRPRLLPEEPLCRRCSV
jgi:hypothetical protein